MQGTGWRSRGNGNDRLVTDGPWSSLGGTARVGLLGGRGAAPMKSCVTQLWWHHSSAPLKLERLGPLTTQQPPTTPAVSVIPKTICSPGCQNTAYFLVTLAQLNPINLVNPIHNKRFRHMCLTERPCSPTLSSYTQDKGPMIYKKKPYRFIFYEQYSCLICCCFILYFI